MDDPTYMNTKPVKECAARIQGLDCKRPRAKDSLFCGQHAYASNRIVLVQHTNESLAYMMQRDGEQQ